MFLVQLSACFTPSVWGDDPSMKLALPYQHMPTRKLEDTLGSSWREPSVCTQVLAQQTDWSCHVLVAAVQNKCCTQWALSIPSAYLTNCLCLSVCLYVLTCMYVYICMYTCLSVCLSVCHLQVNHFGSSSLSNLMTFWSRSYWEQQWCPLWVCTTVARSSVGMHQRFHSSPHHPVATHRCSNELILFPYYGRAAKLSDL